MGYFLLKRLLLLSICSVMRLNYAHKPPRKCQFESGFESLAWENEMLLWNIWCFYSISLGLSPVSSSVCCQTPALGEAGKGGHGPARRAAWSSYQQRYRMCCRMMTVQIIIFVDWDKAVTLWEECLPLPADADVVIGMLFCSGKSQCIVRLASASWAHPAFSHIRWGLHVSCDEIICRFIEIQVWETIAWTLAPQSGWRGGAEALSWL